MLKILAALRSQRGTSDHRHWLLTLVPLIMPPRKRTLDRRKVTEDYFPFNLLPVECQLHIFSFLNEVDKCNCALVCFSWSCIIRSWKLWRVADYSRRSVFNLGQEGLLVSNREFEKWRSWVHLYTHHLISRRASLLTLKASFDLGDRYNKWGELLSHLLDHVHCRDLSRLDLNWTFTLLEPLDVKVHSSSQKETKTKMDQVTILSRFCISDPKPEAFIFLDFMVFLLYLCGCFAKGLF